MSKRTLIIIIFVIMMGLIVAVGYFYKAPFPPKSIPTAIHIITLPSPPHYKVINQVMDIRKVIAIISNLDLKPLLYLQRD